jgi:hypothetical protein
MGTWNDLTMTATVSLEQTTQFLGRARQTGWLSWQLSTRYGEGNANYSLVALRLRPLVTMLGLGLRVCCQERQNLEAADPMLAQKFRVTWENHLDPSFLLSVI